jgi:asparagine synthetase B (glutamine-hydrolysing)
MVLLRIALMCGIAGIVGRLDERNRAALERMNDAMLHRGPDASGTWVSAPDVRGWGMTHLRLSILDLSPAGSQPMTDPVTAHVLTFNGEIYNFADLRRRLMAEGQEFKSTGDTAVMLRALGLHGPGAVSWLRGMFALACWDPKQRRLLLARDPLGIKPLYLARASDPSGGWSVAFASELRALLASGLLGTPRLDPQAVASGVWNGFAAAIGTEHHEVVLTEQHFIENLEAALDSLDQPTFDGLNSYYMSHAIRSAGFTVALSGSGGDELFGGYASYRDLPVLQRWSRRTALLPGCLKVAAATLASRLLSPSGRTVPSQTRWQSCPRWSVAAPTFWRSTSWPTRSSCPVSSVNFSRQALPKRWPTGFHPP